MTVFLNSRYANGPLAQVRAGETYTTTVFRRFPGVQYVVYIDYTWKDGDQIDSFAHALFGDSSLWWKIMDANPEVLDPFNIAPGTILRVPRV